MKVWFLPIKIYNFLCLRSDLTDSLNWISILLSKSACSFCFFCCFSFHFRSSCFSCCLSFFVSLNSTSSVSNCFNFFCIPFRLLLSLCHPAQAMVMLSLTVLDGESVFDLFLLTFFHGVFSPCFVSSSWLVVLLV